MLNIVDAFSKYVFSYLIKNKEATTIHKLFQQVILERGAP